MIKRIQHLCGTEAEWSSNDLVIPKGELAILATNDGRYRIKIGDGVNAFSALPFTDSNYTIITAQNAETITLYMKNGTFYKITGNPAVLKLRQPASGNLQFNDFSAQVSFETKNAELQIDTLSSVIFSGDDIAGGIFIPEFKKRYTLFFWYDGRLNCVVRGVPYE